VEMLKFLGIIIEMGLIQMPKLEYYWSNSQLYGSAIIRSAIARDRFELFLKFWHFSYNHKYHSNQDSLLKLKALLDLLKARFSSVYIPGAVITVDGTMIPWRGRLLFKQYIPGKTHKYKIKMYKLAATNGYMWNFSLKRYLCEKKGKSIFFINSKWFTMSDLFYGT
jgi:hypothetical protein